MRPSMARCGGEDSFMARGADVFRPRYPPDGMAGVAPPCPCTLLYKLRPSLSDFLGFCTGASWPDGPSDECVRVGSAKGARGESNSGKLVVSLGLVASGRPKPNRRLMGLIGGTGGATKGSAPFLREAPGGRSTVSMTEVVDTNTGSDISLLAIDFLRSWPCLTKGCAELGVKAAAFGVVGFDVGGVGLEENGGTGDG
jgi:hypothetical protein